MRSLPLRPGDSLITLEDDFVNRLQRLGFPHLCYPSYKASDFYLGGTISH